MANVIKKKKKIVSKKPYIIGLVLYGVLLIGNGFEHFISPAIFSLAVFYLSKVLIFRDRYIQVEEEVQYEDMDVKDILASGNVYLDSFEKARRKIKNYEVRVDVRNIIHISNQILEEVKNDPSDVKHIRKFITYYLPTIDKLLTSYVDMEAVKETDQIIQSKRKIEELLKTVQKAFESLYDSLFEDEAIDLMTEASVLEKVIAQEGLINEKKF